MPRYVRKALILVACVAAATTAVPASAKHTRDRTRPRIAFQTPDKAILVSPADAVSGRATDKGRGILRVTVEFQPCRPGDYGGLGNTCGNGFGFSAAGGWWDAPNSYLCSHAGGCGPRGAVLACNAARTSCTWSVTPPPYPGVYLVLVDAFDRAGNRAGDLITIFVV